MRTARAWADYPTLGFNGDWVVLQTNVFTVSQGAYVGSYIYAFDKADFTRAAPANHGVLRSDRLHRLPGVPTQHARDRVPGGKLERRRRTLRIRTITGAVGAEVLTTGVAFPKAAKGWQDAAAENFAPQLGSTARIDTDDDRIENCVYRNGSLWAAQTVYFPATGTPTRASAQWWQINTASGSVGVVQQLGKRDDPKNAFDYAYPTLNVNANDDMMLGYSRSGASQYASANYSIRLHGDAPNTSRPTRSSKRARRDTLKTCTGDTDGATTATLPLIRQRNRGVRIEEYASNDNTWGTWWGTVALAARLRDRRQRQPSPRRGRKGRRRRARPSRRVRRRRDARVLESRRRRRSRSTRQRRRRRRSRGTCRRHRDRDVTLARQLAESKTNRNCVHRCTTDMISLIQ